MLLKTIPALLSFYFLIWGCSQGNNLKASKLPAKLPAKQLSQARHRQRALSRRNPDLARFIAYVQNNDINQVKKIVASGSNLHLMRIDDLGTTALGVAVQKGHEDMVKCFLADPRSDLQQICDQEGNGLLMTALINRHIDVAVLLLQAPNIDIHQSNKRDQRPLGIAISRNQIGIVQMLLANA